LLQMADPTKAQLADFGVWNSRFAGGLMALAVISALPLASNRPLWWLIWTLVIAAMAVVYHLLAWPRLRLRAARIRPFAGLFALAAMVPAMAVLQSLAHGGSVVPQASQLGALRVLGYLMFFALVIEVATRRARVLWMTRILFYGISFQAVWALLALNLLGDVAVFWQKTAYLGMATGSFVNRNGLACFLGFGLILGSALLGAQTDRAGSRSGLRQFGGESGVILAAMLIQALALLATQSRLGLGAALAGLMVTVLLQLRQRAGLLPLAMLLAGLGLLGLLWGQGVFERMLVAQTDAATRIELYRQILAMIQQRPWTGFGFDGFAPAFETFRAPPLAMGVSFGHAHNSYLGLWAELGVVVGSLPPVLGLLASGICWRRLRCKEGYDSNAAAAIGALVLAALNAAADFSLEIPANAYVALAILGMGLSRRPARHHRGADLAQRNIA
jgi:O-antigen ligase